MSTATETALSRAWVSASLGAQVLSSHPQRIRDLARDGKIRRRLIEGGHPRYSLQDILALAEAQPTGADTGPATVDET